MARRRKAPREAAKGSDAFTESLKRQNDQIAELDKSNVWNEQTEKAEKFTAELEAQETTLRIIQAALDRLEDAKFGAREALLNDPSRKS